MTFQPPFPLYLHTFRPARETDLHYIEHLANKWRKAVGFLPKEAVRQYIRWGLVELGLENDEPAGYVLYKLTMPDNPGITAIFQTAVQLDARRHSIGRQLIREIEQKSIDSGNQLIQLWCASDLEANEFWSAAGFHPIALRQGGKQRKRLHIAWRLAHVEDAEKLHPFSNRRRNVNGPAVIIPEKITADTIISGCKTDNLRALWTDLTKAHSTVSSVASYSSHGCSDSAPASLFDRPDQPTHAPIDQISPHTD